MRGAGGTIAHIDARAGAAPGLEPKMTGIDVAFAVGGVALLAMAFSRSLIAVSPRLAALACGRGWHRWRAFRLERRVTWTLPTLQVKTRYLGVGGAKIEQCRDCGVFRPPEGREVHAAWAGGRAASSDRGAERNRLTR